MEEREVHGTEGRCKLWLQDSREAGADSSQVLAGLKFYTALRFSETHRQKVHYSLEFLVDNPTPTPFCDLANINNPGTSKKVNNSLIKA